MKLACLLTLVSVCSAQKLHVYSPLTRVHPTGDVVKVDRGTNPPRHILSPGVPRNAFSSLRIAVELNGPDTYILDIGQNPDNAVKATLYKEAFIETAHGFIPDGLQKVDIPYRGFPTDLRHPGQRVITFWLDMWVDRNAEVDRVKVEPQLWVEKLQDWIVYPMEVRIQSPVVPDQKMTYANTLPPLTDPADSVLRSVVRSAACGAKPDAVRAESKEITARDLLRRNAVQHMSLLKDPAALRALITKATGTPDSKWCAEPVTPPAGPEWYLRFRDGIYRAAGAND